MRFAHLRRTVLGSVASLLLLGAASGQLAITEVMSGSAHPVTDPITGFGGLANGDWFEIVNVSSQPIDMTGWLWDDNVRLGNLNGFTQFPNNFVIQPNEAVLVVEEDMVNVEAVGGFREAWGLPLTQRILARDMMLGPDLFSGISSTNGDEVNIYDPQRNLVVGVVTPVMGAARGYSFEWDTAQGSLQESVLGENGAYRALLDGSELPPPYPFLDIASPGIFVRPAGQPGDFNGDGNFSCADVDALVVQIVGQQNPTNFDLTGDGLVNTTDLSQWLSLAGNANLGPGRPYRQGDANLDGVVDGSDFGIWNSNKFTSRPAWCSADFNADGVVDGSDFGIWNSNKFTASDGVSAVPEPTMAIGLCLAICLACLRNGRSRR